MIIQHGEILKYDELLIDQPVMGANLAGSPVAYMRYSDLIIVVGDCHLPMIKVMVPSGAIGWTKFRHDRMIKLEAGAR